MNSKASNRVNKNSIAKQKRGIKALIKRAKHSKRRIRSDSWLRYANTMLQNYRTPTAERDPWDARRQLMEFRFRADQQVAILSKCIADFKRIADDDLPNELRVSKDERMELLNAYRVGLFGELGDRNKLQAALGTDVDLKRLRKHLKQEEFVYPDSYARIIDSERLTTILEVQDLESLISAFEARRSCCKQLAKDIRRKNIRLNVLHAMFRLSERGRVQIGSLMIGGLVLLGMFYMFFYYQAAAGQFVHRYWTLDDLFIQGINVAWLVGLVLIVFEFGFRWLLRGLEQQELRRSQWCQKMLRHPNRLVWVFVAILLLVTSGVGQLNGSDTFGYFVVTASERENELESAAVTGGTILEKVHLVGTTSTTAVFLQMHENGVSSEQDISRNYFDTWRQLILLAPWPNAPSICAAIIPSPCLFTIVESVVDSAVHIIRTSLDRTKQTFLPEPIQEVQYRVLVLDRAQVICHATGNSCVNFSNGVENIIVQPDSR